MFDRRKLGMALMIGALFGCRDEPREETVDTSELRGAPIDAVPAEAGSVAAEPPGPPQEAPGVEPDADGLWPLRWQELMSFDYTVPRRPDLGPAATVEREQQIPERVRAWEGRRVRIDGYMMPIDVDGEEVRLFNLFHSLESCCFGTLAQITNWIEVEMPKGQGVEYFPYGQIEVTGELTVGEYHASGGVVAIYRLKGETAESKW